MPAVPLSRASAITFHAPAASSDSICSTHTYGAMMCAASLLPTSDRTVKPSAASRSISASLRSCVMPRSRGFALRCGRSRNGGTVAGGGWPGPSPLLAVGADRDDDGRSTGAALAARLLGVRVDRLDRVGRDVQRLRDLLRLTL